MELLGHRTSSMCLPKYLHKGPNVVSGGSARTVRLASLGPPLQCRMPNAKCHLCPLLAPSLLLGKKTETDPRWCSNVCAEHFRDQIKQISSISTVVQFEGITTEAQAKNAVMHLRSYSWGAYAPVCKMCKCDSTVVKLKTQELLSARHVATLNSLLSTYTLSKDEFNWLNNLAVQGPPEPEVIEGFYLTGL
jgi:hypothetical protein